MTMQNQMSRTDKIEWAHLVEEIVIEARKGTPGSIRAKKWFLSQTWHDIKYIVFTPGRRVQIEMMAGVRKLTKERDEPIAPPEPVAKPKVAPSPEEIERVRKIKRDSWHKRSAEKKAGKLSAQKPVIPTSVVWPSSYKGIQNAKITSS
jgi:hypothetical protein